MSAIDEAKQYVIDVVQSPALNSALPLEIKSKVRNSNIWLSKFNRVGDLLSYLRRFKGAPDDPVYTSMKRHNLLTFEDILPNFERKFEAWASDRTRLTDFVIGEEYNPFEILIFCNTYDTRSGGMFVLSSGGTPTCVVIKATLNGGKYANEWMVPGQLLKYYLKSKRDLFNEEFAPNKAILSNHDLPIATFVRNVEGIPFTYFGLFQYDSIVREADGPKYFSLRQMPGTGADVVIAAEHAQSTFQSSVQRSIHAARDDRLVRLAKAPKKPVAVTLVSKSYQRNPDVVAEVLFRAAGKCERCNGIAPFARRSDGSPYLEVHHKVQLAHGGDDTIENAIALCPNCHRELHFGEAAMLR
jgi:5-methylcytosine-specific restriction protein A